MATLRILVWVQFSTIATGLVTAEVTVMVVEYENTKPVINSAAIDMAFSASIPLMFETFTPIASMATVGC